MATKAGRQPFNEQLAAIKKRTGKLIPTRRWDDIMHNAHDRGFAVAGAMKADLLADFAKSVEKMVADGKSLDHFRKDFDKIVARHGWSYTGQRNWRTRVIYGTNMRTSYATGRLAQLRDPDLKAAAPYWMYHHGGSDDPRPQHLAWDKLVLPADDPWWQEHYPPNGWGCNCYITAVSRESAERLGGRIEETPPADAPGSIDKGWDYMPGADVADELREQLVSKVVRLPPELASRHWTGQKSLADVHAEKFASWTDEVLAKMQRRGESMLVGVLSIELIDALKARNIRPATAAVVVDDKSMLHTFRSKKSDKLPVDWYRYLPKHLENPQAVLLERGKGGTKHNKDTLFFVYPDPAKGSSKKLVIPIDYEVDTRLVDHKKAKLKGNMVHSGRIVETTNLKGADIELLFGRIEEEKAAE